MLVNVCKNLVWCLRGKPLFCGSFRDEFFGRKVLTFLFGHLVLAGRVDGLLYLSLEVSGRWLFLSKGNNVRVGVEGGGEGFVWACVGVPLVVFMFLSLVVCGLGVLSLPLNGFV